MTVPETSRKPSKWRWAWHLLWVLPAVLVVTWFGLFWITLLWCGVSGCSGGGFGRITDPSLGGALVGAAVVAFVWFAAISGLGWHESFRVRRNVGATAGLVIGFVTLWCGTAGFIQ